MKIDAQVIFIAKEIEFLLKLFNFLMPTLNMFK